MLIIITSKKPNHFIAFDSCVWEEWPKAERCPCCKKEGAEGDIKKRRMSTKYVDEERNWLRSCGVCYAEAEAYWKERWYDYYRDVL